MERVYSAVQESGAALQSGQYSKVILHNISIHFSQEVNESPETLKYLWYPELEIYGLETFGRQRVLKEMSGVRMGKNKTINYELG